MEPAPVVDHDAAVLDHGDPGFVQPKRGRIVPDAELHPDGGGAVAKCENFVHVARDVFRGSEDVDQVRGLGNFRDRAAAGFPQYVLEPRVDRKDAVALGLEVGRNAVGVVFCTVLDSEDGNPVSGFKQVADGDFVFDQRAVSGDGRAAGPLPLG